MDKQKYVKGGSAVSKGSQFQVHLLAVFLLNALRMKLTNWRLSTEDKRAGKFDDVVLEWSEGAVLLQAKHKENKKMITVEQLLSTTSKNDDFSIPKYCLSYQEIRDEFPLLRKAVICTNASVNEKALTFLNPQTYSSDSILFCEGDRISFYTLTDEILSELKDKIKSYHCQNRRGKEFDESVISDKNLRDFQNHFRIYFEYPSGNNLENAIEQLLDRTTWRAKASASEIYSKVMEWFQQKDGNFFTELHAKVMIPEIRKDKYWQLLKQYDVNFPSDDLNFEASNRKYHLIIAEDAYLLQEIRIWHALRRVGKNVLYMHPEDSGEDQKQLIEAFQLPKYIILIIIIQPSGSVAMELWDRIEEILTKHVYKKVVLLTASDNRLVRLIQSGSNGFDVIKKPPKFDDLLKGTRDRLLKMKSVLLQGKSVSMEDLFVPESIRNYRTSLGSAILEKLVRGEQIRVGSEVSVLDEEVEHSYIPRSFIRENDERHEENIFEVRDKLVLIADSAGTGKSTTLTKIAVLLKKIHPHLWILKVILPHYYKFLKSSFQNHKKTIDIKELLNSQEETQLTNQLDNLVFSLSNKVVLMLDGMDEINPNYNELVEGLLVNCLWASNIVKMFVSTRPHLFKKLEEKFNVKSFVLEPLSQRNQIDFLKNHWIHNLGDTNRKKCEQYARSLVDKISSWTDSNLEKENTFAAIPLQVKMVAEIFQESHHNGMENWEGCKEFLNADTLVPKLPENNHLRKLYKLFIEKKRDVFINKLNANGSDGAEQALLKQFTDSIALHRTLALEVIFVDERIYNLFSCHSEGRKDWISEALKMGIVQEVDSRLHFVHRTFAEYFVAECLIIELKRHNQNAEFQKLLIDEMLPHKEFKVICTFFDGLLQECEKDLSNDIFRSYRSLSYYICPSDFSYARLVHDLAEEGWVATLRLLLKCVNFKVIRGKETSFEKLRGRIHLTPLIFRSRYFRNRLNSLQFFVERGGINITDFKGKTPLHLAARRGHMDMVKFLIEQGASVNTTSDMLRPPLYEAASGGHLTVVEFLVEQGAESQAVYLNGNLELGLDAEYAMLPFAAAYLGRMPVLKFLVQRGLDVNRRITNQDPLIFGAAMGGQLEAMEYILQQGAEINSRDNKNNTLVHSVSHDSSLIGIGKFLIDAGVDIDAKNDDGITALHFAASAGAYNMAKFLIENGADVNSTEKYGGQSIIETATFRNRLTTVELLAKHGADVNVRNTHGNTLLHTFIWLGRLDVVKRLVKIGAHVAAEDRRGYTALRIAIIECKLDIVRFLVECPVDVNSRGHYGQTELHFAVSMTVDDVVLYTSYTNMKYLDNKTAFHCLATERLHICMLLVKHGANYNITNSKGQTVLYLAILSIVLHCSLTSCDQCLLVVKFLIEVGASIDIEGSIGDAKVALAKEIQEHERYHEQSLEAILRLPIFRLLDTQLPSNRESELPEMACKDKRDSPIRPDSRIKENSGSMGWMKWFGTYFRK